jgi:hypothetical protein
VLVWTVIIAWLLLGAWAWWIYFRGGVRYALTETWLFKVLALSMLTLLFCVGVVAGPISFLMLIEGEPQWE